MTENMQSFMEAVSQDDVLKAELAELVKSSMAKDRNALIEFAAKNGFTLTVDDFRQENRELSEDELKAIAGGDCSGGACGVEFATWCSGGADALMSW